MVINSQAAISSAGIWSTTNAMTLGWGGQQHGDPAEGRDAAAQGQAHQDGAEDVAEDEERLADAGESFGPHLVDHRCRDVTLLDGELGADTAVYAIYAAANGEPPAGGCRSPQ